MMMDARLSSHRPLGYYPGHGDADHVRHQSICPPSPCPKHIWGMWEMLQSIGASLRMLTAPFLFTGFGFQGCMIALVGGAVKAETHHTRVVRLQAETHHTIAASRLIQHGLAIPSCRQRPKRVNAAPIGKLISVERPSTTRHRRRRNDRNFSSAPR